MSDSTPHGFHSTGAEGPAIGQDEWVARHAAVRFLPERFAVVEQRLRVVPWWAWLTLFVGVFCLFPIVEPSGYVRQVAFQTVLYMLLALGLNVVVGWGGLLDLGYVAFYGIGAYAYALLDSPHYGVHLPTLVSVPLIVVIGALAGLVLGLPSWRLTGDYLAIVTLFFLQLFQTVTTNWQNVTGGPFGILNVDPFGLPGGHKLQTEHSGVFAVSYLYVALAFFVVVFVALRLLNNSRTGRAWRSLREDPLAAEAMGMPVNWLKLLAFSCGAAVAALTGSLYAALFGNVFPLNFYFVTLITIYTMVILGGSGNQAGVVLGALIISPLLELLRDADKSRVLFFAALVGGFAVVGRRRPRLAVVGGATLVFGFVLHAIARAIDGGWVAGQPGAGGFARFVEHWVIAPEHPARWIAPVAYVGVIAIGLLCTVLRGILRDIVLVPTIYLGAFVWENVMLSKPEPARYIVLGVILIVLMVLRPNGLLGERRVEIV
ncbi:MAG TPA: branched-chain amino acid ABC transporter permease [Gaiellaceae bacterium]|jgi:branched-chain amino acid transport system permease protein